MSERTALTCVIRDGEERFLFATFDTQTKLIVRTSDPLPESAVRAELLAHGMPAADIDDAIIVARLHHTVHALT